MADVQDGANRQIGEGISWDAANADNREVYSGFLGLTKWAILMVVAVLIGMALFLV